MTLLFVAGILLASAVGLWLFSRRWKRLWKVVTRIGAAVLALVSPLVVLLFLFRGLMCGRYDFPAVQAPDGSWVASVSEEDCGATDSFHSSVQIWRRGWYALLIPSEGMHRTVFSTEHDPRLLQLEWKGRNFLLIRYPNDSRSPDDFCRSKWGDVQIECVSYTPDYSKPVANMPSLKRWLY
jgi:hypothetical protein